MSADREAFEAHVAEVAPWFAPGDEVMARLAATSADMAEMKGLLEAVRPEIDRLIELGENNLQSVEQIAAAIPGAVWDATPELIDDWEWVCTAVGGDAVLDAIELGERLANIDPPVTPRSGQGSTSPREAKSAPTAKALPPEAIAYLVEHGAPVAYPAGAVNSRRDHESPPQSVHFRHWFAEARSDIAGHGLPWAEGHLEGLAVASSISTHCGEWTSLTHEQHGRPDPLAASSDAWVERENAAELADAMRGAA